MPSSTIRIPVSPLKAVASIQTVSTRVVASVTIAETRTVSPALTAAWPEGYAMTMLDTTGAARSTMKVSVRKAPQRSSVSWAWAIR